ncbi:MAG: hypothetical protein KI792_12865 [Alphaproteobacteria bacterium]|nr:hypothetical protein [Alphaproteobacteria bacterium SS10]
MAGRPDQDLLASLQIDPATEVYICGPTRFMADIQDMLEGLGLPASQIHTETFGPSTGGNSAATASPVCLV